MHFVMERASLSLCRLEFAELMANILTLLIGELQVDRSPFVGGDYLRQESVAREPEFYLKLMPALRALELSFRPIPVELLTNGLGVDFAFGALLR